MHRPHAVQPRAESIRVAIAYTSRRGLSHIGLGVTSLNTMTTLRKHGTWAEVWACDRPEDLRKRLEHAQEDSVRCGRHPVSHVVVSALWVPTVFFQALLMEFPEVHFAVVSHSNFGFLMADPQGVKLLREAGELQGSNHNFAIGGNSQKFVRAWEQMFGMPMVWLPNLYNVESMRHVGQRSPWHGGTLRIGIFGAVRPLKNMVSAVAAAMNVAARHKVDLEIWMSSGREETAGGGSPLAAIDQLVAGLPHVRLIKSGWRSWAAFRAIVSKMHLLMQPSYTESFNMVTADGCAEGVSSVVSQAIEWVPNDWQANSDDVDDIARTASRLLHDRHAVDEGQRALQGYVHRGLHAWRSYLMHESSFDG